MAGWADLGASPTQQCGSSQGQCSPFGSLHRAGSSRSRSLGHRPSVGPDRGATSWGVHQPFPFRCSPNSAVCALGQSEVDHDHIGLHKRDGSDCLQKVGSHIQGGRQGPIWSRAESKESSKESSKREGQEECAKPRGGDSLILCAGPSEVSSTSSQQKGVELTSDFHSGLDEVKDGGLVHSRCPLPSSSSTARAPRGTVKHGRGLARDRSAKQCRGPSNVPEKIPAKDLHSATTSFCKIAAAVPRWILETRTKFAGLLARTFSLQCRGDVPASIVFPLPLADFGLFAGCGSSRLSKRRLATLLRKRLLHVVIVALNYFEGGLSHNNVHLLGRCPNARQKQIHARLWTLIAMCDSPSLGAIPVVPGRSGPEFIARLAELEQFAEGHQLFETEHYTSGPADFERKPVGSAPVDDENLAFQPYTSLVADRLKIVGEGAWKVQEHLDGVLWLPFVEPKILHHSSKVDWNLGPNLSLEDPEECLKLALIWDRKKLLGLTSKPPHRESFTRIFNCYKTAEHDRQIGDRRFGNMVECSLQGPSKFLPGGYMLTNLHVPKGKVAYGSISDRKDFYHQCASTRARTITNVLPFHYDRSCFEGTSALEELRALEATKRPGREAGGDRLGLAPSSLLVEDSSKVYPCFKSLLQGDHLGVEYATAGHEDLLIQAGLLKDHQRIRGHHPLPLTSVWEGLVIDDYFAVSVNSAATPPESSESVSCIQQASLAYEKSQVLGSPEKDILGSRHFKVVGAEVDSSVRAVGLKAVTVSAPLQKRLAMVQLSLRVARLPVISSALASRLAGNWTSIFMFRRCLACVLSELYAYGHGGTGKESDVYVLQRSTAEELVLASIFAFVACSDVSVDYDTKVYATDASMQRGAVVSRSIPDSVSKILWLGGDKKGAYTSLDPPFRELVRALGEDESDRLIRGPPDDLHPKWKAPDFSFDFIEICAGVGSVSKKLADMGFRVAPPIEISNSQHFDVTDIAFVNWLCSMISTKRIRALMVEPVCTSFSAAAHPAVRSYKVPKGFNRKCAKTLRGNEIAFNCLFFIWFASLHDCPSLCEQPRLSKMAWLSVWQFLIKYKGFREAIVASCQFGSIHRKEFRLLGRGLDMEALEVRCPGGHDHVRIEGRWTKDSAIYVPALAEHFARAFAVALRRQRTVEEHQLDVRGLESVLSNDVLTTGSWETDLVWCWRRPAHINVLESSAFVSLLKLLVLSGGDVRFSVLMDSQVAKCSHAKGRSSARALLPTLRKSAVLQISGGLYPSYGFAPTRLNTADGPSRQKEIGEMNAHSLIELLDDELLQFLHSICLSRVASSWVRLTLLLSYLQAVGATRVCPTDLSSPGIYSSWLSWIFTPTASSGFAPCQVASWIWSLAVHVIPWIFAAWIFASRLPCLLRFGRSVIGRFFLCWSCAIIFFWLNEDSLVSEHIIHEPQALPHVRFPFFAAAMPVAPVNSAEAKRAVRRAEVVLHADRVVRPQTRTRREKLLALFNDWLLVNAEISLTNLLQSQDFQPEDISELLVEYGKALFYGGKSYGCYAETINGVASKKPVLRRQLVGAWDLAFSWVADEPARHHPAMPLSVILAFASLALLWGWPVESALLLLTWTGLLRIGEVLAARRRDLILPKDGAPGLQFALLQIEQPKTRGVAAKHQAARIDPEDVVSLLAAVFGTWDGDERLWKLSPSTMRKRFATLLRSLGLPTQRTNDITPFDLASLRPGGATWLLHRFEDAELVRRRGRWVSVRVLEIYLQEVQACTYQARIPKVAQKRVADLSNAFPAILEKAIFFLNSSIPCTAWARLW